MQICQYIYCSWIKLTSFPPLPKNQPEINPMKKPGKCVQWLVLAMRAVNFQFPFRSNHWVMKVEYLTADVQFVIDPRLNIIAWSKKCTLSKKRTKINLNLMSSKNMWMADPHPGSVWAMVWHTWHMAENGLNGRQNSCVWPAAWASKYLTAIRFEVSGRVMRCNMVGMPQNNELQPGQRKAAWTDGQAGTY